MGGQNHQPTRTLVLIAPSAWLSQKVGEGFASVLEANSALESAIIVAMRHLNVETIAAQIDGEAEGHLSKALASLSRSLRSVDEIEIAYDHLLEACRKDGYFGNPLASRISDLQLHDAFSGTLVLPQANADVWNEVEGQIQRSNTVKTLAWEKTQFGQLREPTAALIATLQICQRTLSACGEEAFVSDIECNKVSLRQAYAKVFSLWNHLHAMFLYSALMMTELFYRSSEFGTLLNDRTVTKPEEAELSSNR